MHFNGYSMYCATLYRTKHSSAYNLDNPPTSSKIYLRTHCTCLSVRWKTDDPYEIVSEAVELHRAMINEMRGVPGTIYDVHATHVTHRIVDE